MKLLIGFFCLFSLFYDLSKFDGEVLMVVILNRHGARTPLHKFPETDIFFPEYEKGVLTYNGWRQQILLGKYIKSKYLVNKQKIRGEPYISVDNPSKQFLIISSPLLRTVESAMAYSLGLFPDHSYNMIDSGQVQTDSFNEVPPIKIPSNNFLLQDLSSFNILISDKRRDILFHGKKCKIHIDKAEDKDDAELINEAEKGIVFRYLQNKFPESMRGISLDDLSNTQIKYFNSAIVCVNFNFEDDLFKMSKDVQDAFSKFIVNYYYLKKLKNSNVTRIMSSQFFDEIVKMFDFKLEKDINKKLYFFDNTQVNYDDLKLIVFSGHDSNILASLKNLIREDFLVSLLKNTQDSVDFLIPKFSSSIEFHLVKRANRLFVRVIYDGVNISDRIQFGKNNEIEYDNFKNLLISKIYPGYENCDYKPANLDED